MIFIGVAALLAASAAAIPLPIQNGVLTGPLNANGQALTNDEVKAGIRKATIALKIFPVICGSAFKNKGVQTMLDAVVDYLPSPLDIPPVQGLDVDHPDKKITRYASDSEPFAALVFKIMTDPYSGQLAFFRVYSGKMAAGESIFNVAKGRKERVGRLMRSTFNFITCLPRGCVSIVEC